MSAETKRTRLTPQARRDQILDRAAELVLADGLAAISMDGVARAAGVSKGLVYNYFPDRQALFAALLQREQRDLNDRGMRGALEASDFADLIRRTTGLYLRQTEARGALIAALLADPGVARLMEAQDREDREQAFRFFVRATRRAYGLPLPTAIAAVDLLWAVTDRAGQLVGQGLMGADEATEMCVSLFVGGLAELARAAPLGGA
ncbi:MAG: TetR/AcrR family transcriptional regulator [Phenylobacterium sp.]|uniref:TetR/AcrR family transcriptional regulator n=1 Tax=Phenylobacterium sp. TaxID=1871053 RepID=UPI002733B2D1|nr:TetR/AcrR family transcriptional regulator [Phenylobacterium sp.]MDP1640574.1 TetR/AcrR family transcriptional regulator [Phenylobacterium sp.]MDP3118265.1 TetR/AcrR family transcriptional regulator [Phenylobacterium sp.]